MEYCGIDLNSDFRQICIFDEDECRSGEPLLRSSRTTSAHPHSSDRLRLTIEIKHVPRYTAGADRSVIEYTVFVVATEARGVENQRRK